MADETKTVTETPQPQQITLDQLSLEQIKAVAYDEARKLEIARNNLQVLNQEIQKREQAAATPATK